MFMNIGPRCGLVVAVLILPSCARYPEQPEGAEFDPENSAKKAIERYDGDQSGTISTEEASAAPGLREAFERIDRDKSGDLSELEIVERIRFYKASSAAVISGSVLVTYRGRPLTGATVTFEPEDFLGKSFKPCSGVTDRAGYCSVSGVEADFPGLYLGFYRVKISINQNGKERLPARYNVETELGYEATTDVPNVGTVTTFALK